MIYVDFIFVDFDKILDKFICFSAFLRGIILRRPCLPDTVYIRKLKEVLVATN